MQKISDGTKIIVRKLLQETDHVLDVADFDDICKLDSLLNKLKNPSADQYDVLCIPVRVSNLFLHYPTISVSEWISRRLGLWFNENSLYYGLGVVYALTMVKQSDNLWVIADAREAKRKIKKFAQTMKCTPGQLQLALSRMNMAAEDSENADVVEYGPLLSLLKREYGETMEYWLTEAGLPLIKTMIADYMRRCENEIEQQRRWAVRNKQPIPSIPKIKADNIMAVEKMQKDLRDKWQTKPKSE